jgi:hypothetical protein
MSKNIYEILKNLDDDEQFNLSSTNNLTKHDKSKISDSDDDIDIDELCRDDMSDVNLEIVQTDENGVTHAETYVVPYKPLFENEKRLLCYSTIHDTICPYKHKCTYAHNLFEQKIDDDKYFLYQMIMDANLMNFASSMSHKLDELYKILLFSTCVCDKCSNNKCTGGYNCRNGIFSQTFKICRNDLMTGECLNKIHNLSIDEGIQTKIKDITIPLTYDGCINGHHLSTRGLMPYLKYVHMKEQSSKNQYQSVRYIDLHSSYRYIKSEETNAPLVNSDESSTDEEINELFKKCRETDFFDDKKNIFNETDTND